MSVLNAIRHLLRFWEMGWWGPAALVLLMFSSLAQVWCLANLRGRKRWLPLMISGVGALILEIGTDVCILTQNYIGILFNGIQFFVTALLLGAAIGYFIWTKVHRS